MFAFFIDHLPLSLRIVGFKINSFPLATLRSQQILILNRAGAAFFFVSAGFMVDIGFTTKNFLLLFSLAWFLLGLITLLYIRSWRPLSKLIALHVFDSKVTLSQTRVIKFKFRHVFVNYPFFVNLIGISIPVLLASFFPDFRGTLLQFGFLLNSIATLLVVFVVEPKFIGHISNDEHDLADEYHQFLITSKAFILIGMSIFSCLITHVYF